MAPLEPATWDWWTWVLHALAAYYLVNFFLHFFRFRRLERRAQAGGAEEVDRFNRALRGFPASGYAKMLGKRPLEGEQVDGASRPGVGASGPGGKATSSNGEWTGSDDGDRR